MKTRKKLTGDRNQCPGCNEYFNSSHAFSLHRTGQYGLSRRCRTLEELFSKGWQLNKYGFWVTSEYPSELALINKTSVIFSVEGVSDPLPIKSLLAKQSQLESALFGDISASVS